VDAREVGEPALRERANEIERRRGVVVGLHHPLGVGDTGGRGRGVVVDHVAAEARDLLLTRLLPRRRARLRELPGDAADLDDRQRRAVGHHGRHLEEDLQLLPDVDGRDIVERLRAIAGLEEEGATGCDFGERPAQLPRLAGEDERRHARQAGARRLGALFARPLRLVESGKRSPGRR
jgi:hypothetical protein